jgi:hypothetical protein
MAVPASALDCDMPRRAVRFWSDLVESWERCSEWRGRNVRNRGCRICFVSTVLPRNPTMMDWDINLNLDLILSTRKEL